MDVCVSFVRRRSPRRTLMKVSRNRIRARDIKSFHYMFDHIWNQIFMGKSAAHCPNRVCPGLCDFRHFNWKKESVGNSVQVCKIVNYQLSMQLLRILFYWWLVFIYSCEATWVELDDNDNHSLEFGSFKIPLNYIPFSISGCYVTMYRQ